MSRRKKKNRQQKKEGGAEKVIAPENKTEDKKKDQSVAITPESKTGEEKKERETPGVQQEKKFEKSATVFITEIGSGGTRFLTIQVLNRNGDPDPGAIVRILDDDHLEKHYDLPPTNKLGITECKIEFVAEKRIGIIVLGTEILPRWMNFRNRETN